MMLMQSMMQNHEEDHHLRETQMQLYHLDMKHVDQERRQREEKIEKHEHGRECCHQELMMVLIAPITGHIGISGGGVQDDMGRMRCTQQEMRLHKRQDQGQDQGQ
eukprot:3444147-Ditylum_brightwellii.AAC.1